MKKIVRGPLRRDMHVASVVLLALIALLLARSLREPGAREVPYSEFVAAVRAGRVSEAVITERRLIGKLRPAPSSNGAPAEIAAVRVPEIDDSAILDDLAAHGARVTGRSEQGGAWAALLLGWMLPIALLASLWMLARRRLGAGTAGAMTFGKNRAKIYDQSEKTKVTFSDVAGVDEAKAELVEVVDFLRNPQHYQKLGGRIPRGVLLVGPPGTGKTLLAKAVAGEAGVPFFSISGSEFVEMFVGVGAARVRDLFEQAKEKAPCIVFIDELDAIGKSRATGRGVFLSNDEREQTLNQLLAEMDGFDTSKGVIILAATNAPEVLDPALLRAGRFDRQVVVDRPDVRGREAILRVHARAVTVAPGVDWKTIAARTPGMVGADLANVVNESALLAARRGAEAVEMSDIEEAIDRSMLGLEKRSRVMTPAEKERVAFHETGHAIAALSVEHANPVHRVTIIPRSIGALGHTLQLPTEERFLMTKPELEDQLAVMLGGRAAEEIAFGGVVSTGAIDDLERASEMARQMVTRFGMSDDLGPVTYGAPFSLRFLSPVEERVRNFSEFTAQAIDRETRRFVDEAHSRVRAILLRRRSDLETVARELIRRETLDRGQLETLIGTGVAEAASTGAPPVPTTGA